MNDKALWYNENIEYIFHENVVEYDMTSADVSVCEQYNLLSKAKIEQLKLMPKDKRNRTIGCIRRDNIDFSKKLQQGIFDIRKEFITANNLDEETILSLHSDAVIFYSKKKIKTDFGAVTFRLDKNYSSYIRYKKMEIFYNDGILDMKPKNVLNQHRLGLCKHIMNVCDRIENYDPIIIKELCKFQTLYLQQKFPEYYYTPFGHGKYFSSNLEFLAFLTNITIKEVRSWG